MSWSDICKGNDEGGLEVKNLISFNDVFLGKWRWNLFHQRGGLWKEVSISKYEGRQGLERGGECSWESLWWRDIKKVCRGRSEKKCFDEGFEWKVGVGDKCKFWKDE